MTGAEAPALHADSSTFSARLRQVFDTAATRLGRIERHYQIAGRHVRITLAGSSLAPVLLAALTHLAAPPGPPELSIHVWDGTTADIVPEAPDWVSQAFYGNSEIRQTEEDGVHVAFDGLLGMLSVLDTRRGLAFCWLRDPRHVPITIAGTPFRIILQWWADLEDRILVHAAALGDDTGALLVAGASGSGKSTTALTAVRAGLKYLGDDFVLVETGPPPAVHCLYNSAKVDPGTLEERFPDLESSVHERQRLDHEKHLLFAHRLWADRIVRQRKLSALLLPSITGRPETRLTAASGGQALRTLLPGIFPFPGMRHSAVERLGRLVRAVKAYRLELGTQSHDIVRAIREALAS